MAEIWTGVRRCVVLLVLTGSIGVGATVAQDAAKLVAEAQQLVESIDEDRAEIARFRKRLSEAVGEERELLERRRMRSSFEALDKLDRLIEVVLAQEAQQLDAASYRAVAEELVTTIAPIGHQRIDEVRAETAALALNREDSSGEALVKLENELAANDRQLDRIIEATLDNMQHMQALGLDSTGEEAYLEEVLTDRGATFAARIQLALEQASAIGDRLADKPDDSDLKTELSAIETRTERSTDTLKTTIAMMNRIGLDTAEYQQLLIESTGRLSADILDTKVAMNLARQWMAKARSWVVESLPSLFFRSLVFVLILLVFRMLAKITRRVVTRAVTNSKLNISQLLQKMFIAIAGNAVWAVGILFGLSQLGFALGPILAGLGILGFIVGFALQETLGNFAAGSMILIYRPFDVGDLIEAAGVFGKVGAMNMVSTTILTLDNQTLIVPNGRIWGDVIKNVTHQKERRVDMTFGISYTDDIPHTEKVLWQIVKEHPKVLEDPEPMIKLHNLGDSSVDFVVRPWCATDDYWDVYWDITREVKMRFDKEGISIPFPQRDVHMYEEQRLAAAG